MLYNCQELIRKFPTESDDKGDAPDRDPVKEAAAIPSWIVWMRTLSVYAPDETDCSSVQLVEILVNSVRNELRSD